MNIIIIKHSKILVLDNIEKSRNYKKVKFAGNLRNDKIQLMDDRLFINNLKLQNDCRRMISFNIEGNPDVVDKFSIKLTDNST